MSDLGLLFTKDNAPIDLMQVYRRRRKIADVVSLVLADQ
jgi:hypothetical protein